MKQGRRLLQGVQLSMICLWHTTRKWLLNPPPFIKDCLHKVHEMEKLWEIARLPVRLHVSSVKPSKGFQLNFVFRIHSESSYAS
jgi:hypothetical protein